MGETTDTLTFKIKAADEASAVFKTAGERAKESIDKLKKVTGEDSAFGGALKLAAGAGGLAAFGLMARGIGAAADAMTSLNEKIASGKATSTDLNDIYVGLIPIIGDMTIKLDEAFTSRRLSEKAAQEFEKITAAFHASVLEMRRDLETMDFNSPLKELAASSKTHEAERQEVYKKLAEARQEARVVGSSPLRRSDGLTSRQAAAQMVGAAETEAGQALAVIEEREAKERKEIQRKYDADYEAAEKSHQERIAALKQDARASNLALLNKDADAEMTRFEQQKAAERAAIDADYQKQLDAIKGHDSQAQVLRDHIADQQLEHLTAYDAAVDAQRAELEKKHTEQAEDHARSMAEIQSRAEAEVADARIKVLRDKGMEYEATMAEIAKSHRQQQDDIAKDEADQLRKAQSEDERNRIRAAAAQRAGAAFGNRMLAEEQARKAGGQAQLSGILGVTGAGAALSAGFGSVQSSIAAYISSVQRAGQLQMAGNPTVSAGGGSGVGAALSERYAVAAADRQGEANKLLEKLTVQQDQANTMIGKVNDALSAFGVKIGVR